MNYKKNGLLVIFFAQIICAVPNRKPITMQQRIVIETKREYQEFKRAIQCIWSKKGCTSLEILKCRRILRRVMILIAIVAGSFIFTMYELHMKEKVTPLKTIFPHFGHKIKETLRRPEGIVPPESLPAQSPIQEQVVDEVKISLVEPKPKDELEGFATTRERDIFYALREYVELLEDLKKRVDVFRAQVLQIQINLYRGMMSRKYKVNVNNYKDRLIDGKTIDKVEKELVDEWNKFHNKNIRYEIMLEQYGKK